MFAKWMNREYSRYLSFFLDVWPLNLPILGESPHLRSLEETETKARHWLSQLSPKLGCGYMTQASSVGGFCSRRANDIKRKRSLGMLFGVKTKLELVMKKVYFKMSFFPLFVLKCYVLPKVGNSSHPRGSNCLWNSVLSIVKARE